MPKILNGILNVIILILVFCLALIFGVKFEQAHAAAKPARPAPRDVFVRTYFRSNYAAGPSIRVYRDMDTGREYIVVCGKYEDDCSITPRLK
jgi:hypothetical protein